ncbi:MAG: GIY-YIG nuclease family protein [Candidatus Obscuribacterales bacterium]|nr:GIY-YIG nuclease family protein [Candidatus Obscuribacterales bacterium]
MRTYYVYIMSSYSLTFYIGVTGNLERRVSEHKQKVRDGFTKEYVVNKLVYFEPCNDVHLALEREKQLKRWSRSKKLELIGTMNPYLCDLSLHW